MLLLGALVYEAVNGDPPDALRAYCGDQYRPYYYLLYLLASHIPKVSVELGVEKGRGSYALALAGGEVWGVDHTRRGEVAMLEAEFPDYHFLEQSSLPVPEPIRGLDVGLLHVDTEHTYAQAREEFWPYKALMRAPAVVCFDDLHAMEHDVGRFVLTLPWPTIMDDRLHECGYGVLLYDGER